MDFIVNHQDSKAIKQLWTTYHVVGICSCLIGISVWFSTPFFTRNVRVNRQHQVFRWASIGIGLGSGVGALSSSLILASLEPKIKALNKSEMARFRHGVASELWMAQQTNSAIALSVTSERKSSLGVTALELRNSPELESSGDSVTEPLPPETLRVTRNETELTASNETIITALNDGLPDSEIIKNVMGFTGRNYQKGKARLDEIKAQLEREEEDE